MGNTSLTIVEIDEYLFSIVDQYSPANALGELILTRQVFETREKAEEHADRARKLLENLGKWERLLSALRNIREGLDGADLSKPERIRPGDLRLVVVERKMHPFRVSVDLADDATTEISRHERPWLLHPETWVAALENLKRWRDLRESLRALLEPV